MDARFVFMERPAKLPMLRSRFEATYSQTLNLLDRELRHLDARQVTIQAGFRAVRNDGWPYASARPDHPACTLQFVSRGQALTFKGMLYSTFEANLRAIALTLEALRAVDRYGVVEGQQYQGFKQLAAPEAHDGTMNRTAALHMIAGLAQIKPERVMDDLDAAYRAAAKVAHPDAGGTAERFRLVTEAVRILRRESAS